MQIIMTRSDNSFAHMQDLEILLNRLENSGLSHLQARASVQVLQQYVAKKYPVMGMLLQGWLNQNSTNLASAIKNPAKETAEHFA